MLAEGARAATETLLRPRPLQRQAAAAVVAAARVVGFAVAQHTQRLKDARGGAARGGWKVVLHGGG